MGLMEFPFPIFITKEGRWLVAECPILSIATQGKTEREVKENMKDLIREYFNDPDTYKINLKDLDTSSFTYVSALVPIKSFYGKTQASISR